MLSKTLPTIIFKPDEVIRCDDTTTTTSLPRRLDPIKSRQIKRKGRGKDPGQVPKPDGTVMNDVSTCMFDTLLSADSGIVRAAPGFLGLRQVQ